jgi:hypothetical protein
VDGDEPGWLSGDFDDEEALRLLVIGPLQVLPAEEPTLLRRPMILIGVGLQTPIRRMIDLLDLGQVFRGSEANAHLCVDGRRRVLSPSHVLNPRGLYRDGRPQAKDTLDFPMPEAYDGRRRRHERRDAMTQDERARDLERHHA